MEHTFHIPVLGLAFSIDSPLKVAQFGIASVMSIVDDELVERMREYYAKKHFLPYIPIGPKATDSRSQRITAYLDLVQEIVKEQIQQLRTADLDHSTDLQKYFELLPDTSSVKRIYNNYLQEIDPNKKAHLKATLMMNVQPGDINVNIMSKVDKINTDSAGNVLDHLYSDASAALRGFAMSNIKGGLVLSAGMNPRLYSYLGELPQFIPNKKGEFQKQVILKVSDYRSALIQAKFLAKKGIWVSEFRVESGLNCGGHAFATEGLLLGPILEEFKTNSAALQHELSSMYTESLKAKGHVLDNCPQIRITAQGGIGTAAEQSFLLSHYGLAATGWGSPFLLVPEATTVDDQTLQALASAQKDDFYTSGASPLGVPFNNFKKSSAELNRLQRIQKGRPGAPCTKKYLISNAEYSDEPICTASRIYQYTKLKELEIFEGESEDYHKKLKEITEKTCLCEGLATSAYLKYDILQKKEDDAVAICPGPNTAYFNSIYSLQDMVDHIYGRKDLLVGSDRPSLFINELNLYIEYLEQYLRDNELQMDDKKEKFTARFKKELNSGIAYYNKIAEQLFPTDPVQRNTFTQQLVDGQIKLTAL
ncbi:hypothetical protein SAMN05660841_03508 [Sphingobacterium nematocida]|uniref:Uncharacterized protein n=1 Tax=Sphingobacterium nematocida TaxID=1513896 RepID=A0A1T5FT67_9SPHI|nr:hypothetical protein [Sphingobacterium nematocida]SKB99375.1 hypothetical protein SAMN05660841_03508 [Sphingobacterium nematocida]